MRRTLAGPGSSTGNYKSTTDPGKALASGGTADGYRRVGQASGPGSSTSEYQATLDPGKQLASGTSGGYRRVGQASGPGSSTAEYQATLDPGKALPSGHDAGGYRRVGQAAGPGSSTAEYQATLDPGTFLHRSLHAHVQHTLFDHFAPFRHPSLSSHAHFSFSHAFTLAHAHISSLQASLNPSLVLVLPVLLVANSAHNAVLLQLAASSAVSAVVLCNVHVRVRGREPIGMRTSVHVHARCISTPTLARSLSVSLCLQIGDVKECAKVFMYCCLFFQPCNL